MNTSNNCLVNKNEPIYMGIDVHKKQWNICVMQQNQVIHKASIGGNIDELKKNIKKFEGVRINSVYEAGFCGFYIHRQLTELGINNRIISASKIPIESGNKVKTDKKDSKKLAQFLSMNMLKSNYIPSEELQGLRQYLRTRYQLVSKRRSTSNQIKSLIIQYGIIIEEAGITKHVIEIIRNNYGKIPKPIEIVIESHLRLLTSINKEIILLEKEVKKSYLKSSYEESYKIVTSVPGIGPITGLALIYEIGDWDRFNNSRQIAAFFGLTPSEYSSGENIRRGRITGQGNDWLRSLLIESSWVLINKDINMKIYFNRIFANTGSKKKAIVATARKLVCIIYSLIKRREMYKLSYIPNAD